MGSAQLRVRLPWQLLWLVAGAWRMQAAPVARASTARFVPKRYQLDAEARGARERARRAQLAALLEVVAFPQVREVGVARGAVGCLLQRPKLRRRASSTATILETAT